MGQRRDQAPVAKYQRITARRLACARVPFRCAPITGKSASTFLASLRGIGVPRHQAGTHAQHAMCRGERAVPQPGAATVAGSCPRAPGAHPCRCVHASACHAPLAGHRTLDAHRAARFACSNGVRAHVTGGRGPSSQSPRPQAPVPPACARPFSASASRRRAWRAPAVLQRRPHGVAVTHTRGSGRPPGSARPGGLA